MLHLMGAIQSSNEQRGAFFLTLGPSQGGVDRTTRATVHENLIHPIHTQADSCPIHMYGLCKSAGAMTLVRGWDYRQSVFLGGDQVGRYGCGLKRVRSSVITHFLPYKLRIPHTQYILLGCARVQVQWYWLGAGTSVNRSFWRGTKWGGVAADRRKCAAA